MRPPWLSIRTGLIVRAWLIACAGLFVAGGFVSMCSLIEYRRMWTFGGVTFPWGLALALAASYFGARAATLLSRPVPGAVSFGLGWVVILVVAFPARPEGDYLIAGDWLGYGFTFAGICLVAIAVGRAASAPIR